MKKLIYSLFVLAITAMTFSSCEDVPAPYNMPQEVIDGEDKPTVDPAGSGTANDPYNVAAANEEAAKLASGETSETTIYIKGKISQISDVDPSFGNATYYISDDGTTDDQFLVYRGYSLGGERFTTEDEIEVGDEVIVCGQLTNYNGTIELAQRNYIYSLNGVTAGGDTEEGDGTEASPYSASQALNLISSGNYDSDAEVYIKGIIAGTPDISTQYGNATYYISDDGTTTNQLYVFRGYYLSGEKFTSENQLKEGDEVVILGKLTTYNGSPQVNTGSKIISVNGESGSTTGDGTETSPYGAAQALSLIESGDYDSNTEVYVKGIISGVSEISTSYGNATYYISDDGTTSNQLYVFRGYYLNGDKFTSESQIKVGDEVVILGKLTTYNGSPQVNSGSKIVSVNGSSSTGSNATISKEGTTITISDASATASSSVLSFTVADLGLSELPSVITLSDGTTISFAQEGGYNSPIYHASSTAFRMYALNSMTITGSKKIAKVVLTCESDRMGNDEMYTTINGNTWKVVNHQSSGDSGGTQLRILAFEITYAE